MFAGMICHELSIVVLLHMRPSQARRLDNIRVLCHRLESLSRLPAPATCTHLEIYQHTSESRLISIGKRSQGQPAEVGKSHVRSGGFWH